jgi:hypothetical protein
MMDEGVLMLCQRYDMLELGKIHRMVIQWQDMLELGKIHRIVIRSLNLCFPVFRKTSEKLCHVLLATEIGEARACAVETVNSSSAAVGRFGGEQLHKSSMFSTIS